VLPVNLEEAADVFFPPSFIPSNDALAGYEPNV